MKTLIVGAVIAIGVFVAIGGPVNSDTHNTSSDDGRLQESARQVDAYLHESLGSGTHGVLAEKAQSSADWLRGLRQQARAVTE